MKMKLMLAAVLAVALLAAPANADLIIASDTFDGSDPVIGLDGTTLSGTPGATWIGSEGAGTQALDDGSIIGGNGSMYHDFTPVNGTNYMFTMNMQYSGTYWCMVGFANSAFPTAAAYDRLNSPGDADRGYMVSSASSGTTSIAPATGASVVVAAAAVNGNDIDLEYQILLTTAADGSSYTLYYAVSDGTTAYDLGSATHNASAAADIAYAVVSYRAPSTANGDYIDNWLIETTTQTIPEPATIGILALGGLVSLMRRRRA